MSTRRSAVLLTALALLTAACSSDAAQEATTSSTEAPTTTMALAPATFTVQPGTGQIAALGLEPGTEVHAIAPDGTDVTSKAADENGAVLFRDLKPVAG